jgi:nuclear transport factor 2 (NTF2) superfamily protein
MTNTTVTAPASLLKPPFTLDEAERKYHWSAPGPRPKDHAGLSELGL